MKKFKENNKGFSLVELIVVIAIMVVLIAVLGSTILGYVDKSKYSKDISALDSINTAVKTFVADPSSDYKDGVYTLDQLVINCDKGGVIMPILAEVFKADKVKVQGADGSETEVDGYVFNNASKTFDGVTTADVYVAIYEGAVSILVEKVDTTYANYTAGDQSKIVKADANKNISNNNNNNNNGGN